MVHCWDLSRCTDKRKRTPLKLEEGEIKGGEVAVFTAVGAGLSWGACALRLGERTTPINTSDAKLPDFDGKAVDTIRKAIEYQIPEKLDLI